MPEFIRKHRRIIITAIVSIISTIIITVIFSSFSWVGAQLTTPYINKRILKGHEKRIQDIEETYVPMNVYQEHVRKTHYDSLNIHQRLQEQDKKLDFIIKMLESRN